MSYPCIHILLFFNTQSRTYPFSITLQYTQGSCITTVIWRCCNPFNQWQHSFQWKLRCLWLKFLRQCCVAIVMQDPGITLCCVLLRFGNGQFHPYPSGLLHWHRGNLSIPVHAKKHAVCKMAASLFMPLCVLAVQTTLTHWGRARWLPLWQTTFSSAFLWIKTFEV